jgi:hypothetical protein
MASKWRWRLSTRLILNRSITRKCRFSDTWYCCYSEWWDIQLISVIIHVIFGMCIFLVRWNEFYIASMASNEILIMYAYRAPGWLQKAGSFQMNWAHFLNVSGSNNVVISSRIDTKRSFMPKSIGIQSCVYGGRGGGAGGGGGNCRFTTLSPEVYGTNIAR